MKISPVVKPAIWGAVGGAIAITIVGFSYFGWTLSSTAERMASDHADKAVAQALAPFCVAKAEADPNFKDQLKKLVATGQWDQDMFVEKAGWATMPGSKTPNDAVAQKCADLLTKAKSS